jgi:hypothetical protein
MPDISMCEGKNCPIKEKCYRYRAFPDSWQWYMNFRPNENGSCDNFWFIEAGMSIRGMEQISWDE